MPHKCPGYIFKGWRNFADPLVSEALAAAGGFHDGFSMGGPYDHPKLEVVLCNPYFPRFRRYKMFDTVGAVLELQLKEASPHAAQIAASESFDIFSALFDPGAEFFELCFYQAPDDMTSSYKVIDTTLHFAPEVSRFKWIFKNDGDYHLCD